MCGYSGPLPASRHRWFGEPKLVLHGAIGETTQVCSHFAIEKFEGNKMKNYVLRLIVRGRFTKSFDEIKLGEGKRDHSGEELFVTELQLKC